MMIVQSRALAYHRQQQLHVTRLTVMLAVTHSSNAACTCCSMHKARSPGRPLGVAPATRLQLSHRQAPPLTRVSAAKDGESSTNEASEPAGREVSGGNSTRGFIRPDGVEPMRLERIERLGEEAWAGVAAVDRGEPVTSLGRAALLVGGDAAALLLFAAVGRGSHAELNGLAGVIGTAWPFLAGWYTGAALTGAYGAAAQGRSARDAAGAAAKAWAIAIPVALVLRGLAKGAPPPLPFVAVASVATAVLLISWRAAFAALSPKAAPGGKSGNRAGNVLEFFSLLGGLTKRW